MKVRATRPGQYDNEMKNIGDVFDIKDEFFTDAWMEKVIEPKTEEKAPEGE